MKKVMVCGCGAQGSTICKRTEFIIGQKGKKNGKHNHDIDHTALSVASSTFIPACKSEYEV